MESSVSSRTWHLSRVPRPFTEQRLSLTRDDRYPKVSGFPVVVTSSPAFTVVAEANRDRTRFEPLDSSVERLRNGSSQNGIGDEGIAAARRRSRALLLRWGVLTGRPGQCDSAASRRLSRLGGPLRVSRTRVATTERSGVPGTSRIGTGDIIFGELLATGPLSV